MTWIERTIQDGWMFRKGWRGRILTTYFHRYEGKEESTERFHRHPWKLAFGILLHGRMTEQFADGRVRNRWIPGSIQFYLPTTYHRIPRATGRSIFVGLFRTQERLDPGATEWTREGFAHYTELNEKGKR